MKTTIDHEIRIKLKLNCLEYCMLDFIASFKFDPVALQDALHISPNVRIVMLGDLQKKGLLFHTGEEVYEVTTKWTKFFEVDHNLINVLWKIHPAGTKNVARTRLPYVLKKIDIDELAARLKAYLKACEVANSFSKNLDTWLEPKKERWNDPLPVKREFKQGQQEVKVTAVTYKTKKLL